MLEPRRMHRHLCLWSSDLSSPLSSPACRHTEKIANAAADACGKSKRTVEPGRHQQLGVNSCYPAAHERGWRLLANFARLPVGDSGKGAPEPMPSRRRRQLVAIWRLVAIWSTEKNLSTFTGYCGNTRCILNHQN
jgi:hypothetical protein